MIPPDNSLCATWNNSQGSEKPMIPRQIAKVLGAVAKFLLPWLFVVEHNTLTNSQGIEGFCHSAQYHGYLWWY